MRNILDRVRKRDRDQVKRDAQAIYRAESRKQAQQAFQQFRLPWQSAYGNIWSKESCKKDLPELLNFFDCPKPVWKKLPTTNLIERCFVESATPHTAYGGFGQHW